MNLQRREEIKVIAECPNDRHWAQEMRRAVAELLAHIATLEQTAAERVIADGKARDVVVPDDDRPSREFLENYVEGFDPGERSAALFGWREGRRHLRANTRAIPAHRVLGDGMVAVDREDASLAAEWCHAVQDLNPGYLGAKDREACERFNALRANQGGAAT